MSKLFSSERFWRFVWLAAAATNMLGVVVFVVWHDELYTSSGQQPPVPGMHYDTWIAFVLVFGVAYYMVSRDLYKWRGIVVLGLLAKIASATPQLWYLIFRREETPALYLVPMLTDYAFAVVFIFFLKFLNTSEDLTSKSLG
jgi:uncharacterized membrane protein (DUF4010 family)